MEGVQGKIQGPGDETQGTGREEKGQVWYRYLLQVVTGAVYCRAVDPQGGIFRGPVQDLTL